MITNSQLRVLVLDAKGRLPVLELDSGRYHAVYETDMASKDRYRVYWPTAETLDWIKRSKGYYIAIVGNNLGAGILKAQYLPPALLGMTFIVWNMLPEDYSALAEPYRQLGIQHFCTRFGLADKIESVLSQVHTS